MPRRKGIFGEMLLRKVVRLVFVLAFFVLDHATLEVQGLLGEVEVRHAVRFHPQSEIKGRGGDIFEIVGAVESSGPVHIRRADGLQRLDVTSFGVLAAAEHQVLEQVRKAGPAGLFVLRADVVPEVHGDDWRFMVFVNDQGQPIVEDESGVRNVRVLRLRRRGSGDNEAKYKHQHPIDTHIDPPQCFRAGPKARLL